MFNYDVRKIFAAIFAPNNALLVVHENVLHFQVAIVVVVEQVWHSLNKMIF